MDEKAKICAIIVAAGRGERSPGDIPKQYRNLAGVPVLKRTIEAFQKSARIERIVVVIHTDDVARFDALNITGVDTVFGGATRTESVKAGLSAAKDCGRILIHDGARPFIKVQLIDAVIEALATTPAVVPVLPLVDAIKETEAGKLRRDADRTDFMRMQTPQGFHRDSLEMAIASADPSFSYQDDISFALAAGLDVAQVQGDENNLKLTYNADFDRAERRFMTQSQHTLFITGQGFDVHRFTSGDHLMICGVRVEAAFGLLGHSDADVGLHAITDAILGACALGDIGDHFPPSDARWKGQSSDLFLEHAINLARDTGAQLVHVDVTIIGEQPKIKPHRLAMRERIAQITALPLSRVSVKATTTEGLGFAGRKEGLSALASVTLETAR